MIFLELFLTFFKIGALTFGGGYAMIPLIQSEVMSHGWLSATQLIDFIAVSESTPGPFAVNIATYIGTQTGGVLGGAAATAGVVLPSFIVISAIAGCYTAYKNNKFVRGAMYGLKPAAVGLVGAAALSVGMAALSIRFDGFNPNMLLEFPFIGAAATLAVAAVCAFKKVHPILIIVISALLGVAFGYLFELL